MARSISFVSCFAIYAAFLFASSEQQPLKVKPGLWQIEQTVAYSGLPPEMQATVDRLTPQQRAAMGIGGTHRYNRCVTEKQLNTSWVEGDQNCKWTVLNSSASDLEVKGTSCRAGRNEGLTSDVLVKIHASDSENLQGTLHGTATGNGVNATLDGTYKGKWISDTCQNDTK
ncbi:MAG: DUF3617 family protein [Acidobacteria bacterium]|nr:DUF3617 family protein [Acidobacteriota bacterium]